MNRYQLRDPAAMVLGWLWLSVQLFAQDQDIRDAKQLIAIPEQDDALPIWLWSAFTFAAVIVVAYVAWKLSKKQEVWSDS